MNNNNNNNNNNNDNNNKFTAPFPSGPMALKKIYEKLKLKTILTINT